MMDYQKYIKTIEGISFDKIIELNLELVPDEYKPCPWKFPGLDHGTAILKTEEQLCAYIAAYGKMHQDKINEVLPKLNISDFQNADIQVVDWGCGQALATICMFDYFNQQSISLDSVKQVTLIEPSGSALERACIHVGAHINDDKVIPINKYLDEVDAKEIESTQPVTIHLFSNILDIPTIDLQLLTNKIKKGLSGKHYFICLGPLNAGNNRIDIFYDYFSEATKIFENVHNKQEYDSQGNLINSYNYTAKNRVFKVDGDSCELILVDYYLPKQFHAAYQLDAVREALNKNNENDKLKGLYRNLSEFEVQTPFDIGASIYEDVHPILAVLNNIVTRGLPTKASPSIEDAFKDFGDQRTEDELGSINYSIDGLKPDELFLAMHLVDSRWNLSVEDYNCKILDSDLEKAYITQASSPIFRQLLQPQRNLSSITNKSWHHSQRVDFAFEFPYPTKDRNGNDRNGCVIEIDGIKYHSSTEQVLSDQQRINELVASTWYCFRLKESEIGKPYEDFFQLGSEYIGWVEKVMEKDFDAEWVNTLQLVLSPIAVARMEKTILEALMTERIDFKANKWEVLVIEHDVPCAALAFKDLKEMFNNIAQLSAEYSDLRFPEIDLTIVSTKEFAKSSLHYSNNKEGIVSRVVVDQYKSNTQFDMVIDCAMLRRAGLEQLDFTQYRCKNKSYFNIRSAHYHRNERQIYTSDRITYKPLVVSNAQGRYDDIEVNVKHLEYFLGLLFRKKEFRPGQTPILSRALQNKSVIGLLPTGGGKSLTYQIAAMLQPGVTLVVDPLRSLMKDQYDGLIKAGIDTCTYINAEANAMIKEQRMIMMEQSLLQFVFLSPERLAIRNFRQRLHNMQDTGVYFAYGVIDEVHCVSEWGHDFRTSYLHLGRNLYNYVLPKRTNDSQHISLFGLTATASFDVLADIERELSGNGAFPLDADVIVRYEYTNRAELQYKIEYIDANPNEREPWAVYRPKNESIAAAITNISGYINELQQDENIARIKKQFAQRVGLTEDNDREEVIRLSKMDLHTEMPSDWYLHEPPYQQAGIVFCPHTKGLMGVYDSNANRGIATAIEQDLTIDNVGRFIGGDNSAVQEQYINNQLSIMVATNAFGMGIDKSNVRFTINMNFPNSLESFVQEAGRAGRDKRIALATILYSDYGTTDRDVAKYFHDESFLGKDFEKWCLWEVCNCAIHGKNEEEKGILNSVDESYLKSVVLLPYTKGISDEVLPHLLNCLRNGNGNHKKLIGKIENKDPDTIAQIYAKTIFRMCCIGLVTDYTQDYNANQFRIEVMNGNEDFYYNNLFKFYTRYFKEATAMAMVMAAKHIVLLRQFNNPIHEAIFKCLTSLTDFVYDQTAAKRLQAINDIEAFCQEGLNTKYVDWLEANEGLKDYIYYYFNSKYARENYQTTTGQPYSLLVDIGIEDDTNVLPDEVVLFKYLRVVNMDWIENESEPGSAQINNIKHLYGAVRLLRGKSIEASKNPAMKLLLAFCLMFLGTNNNKVLEEELANMYIDGMTGFHQNSINTGQDFWKDVFEKFNGNQYVSAFFRDHGTLLKSSAILEIHKLELDLIKNKYIE